MTDPNRRDIQEAAEARERQRCPLPLDETLGFWMASILEKHANTPQCSREDFFRNLGLELRAVIYGDVERKARLLGFDCPDTLEERKAAVAQALLPNKEVQQ